MTKGQKVKTAKKGGTSKQHVLFSTTTTKGKTTTMTNSSYGFGQHQGQGSKSGGFHVGGCGHRGKIEVWRHGGRAFYAAGTSVHLGDDIAAVIDLAGSAQKELQRWVAPPAPVPPAPPEKVDLVKRATDFVKGQVTKSWLDRVIERLKAQQALTDLEWDRVAAEEYAAWQQAQAATPAKTAEYTTEPPVYIPLDWPDFQAPSKVGASFWQALWAELPEGTPEQPAKIVVCCMGGHGRTGTCLAALMIVGAGMSAPNAVNLVRLNHCVSAVESDTQVNYLRALAKRLGTESQPLDVAVADQLDGLTTKATPTVVHQPSAQKATPEGPLSVPVTVHDAAPKNQQIDHHGKIRLSDVPSATKVLISAPSQAGFVWVLALDYLSGMHGAPADYVYGVATE